MSVVPLMSFAPVRLTVPMIGVVTWNSLAGMSCGATGRKSPGLPGTPAVAPQFPVVAVFRSAKFSNAA